MKTAKLTVKKGMGATLCVGSDRYPYTVIEASDSGKTIQVQRDNSVPAVNAGYDYFSKQIYSFHRNDSSPKETFRYSDKFKCFVSGSRGTLRLFVGKRERYDDPNF